MSGPAECQLLGRWQIVESDIWDNDYLDLVAPASILFEENGHGEFAFGAHEAGVNDLPLKREACSRKREQAHVDQGKLQSLANDWM